MNKYPHKFFITGGSHNKHISSVNDEGLQAGVSERPPAPGLIFHSNQGNEYEILIPSWAGDVNRGLQIRPDKQIIGAAQMVESSAETII